MKITLDTPGRSASFVSALAIGVATLTNAVSADAQQLQLAAKATAGSGVEGGGRGAAEGIRRTRTTLTAGAEAFVDEFPKDIFDIGLLLEVEPHAAGGAYANYVRLLGKKAAGHVGVTLLIAPETLLGPSVGAEYRHALSSSATLTAGPSLQVFVLGNDLPSGSILWQGLLQVGIRADL